jgi:hypothetical protein
MGIVLERTGRRYTKEHSWRNCLTLKEPDSLKLEGRLNGWRRRKRRSVSTKLEMKSIAG